MVPERSTTPDEDRSQWRDAVLHTAAHACVRPEEDGFEATRNEGEAPDGLRKFLQPSRKLTELPSEYRLKIITLRREFEEARPIVPHNVILPKVKGEVQGGASVWQIATVISKAVAESVTPNNVVLLRTLMASVSSAFQICEDASLSSVELKHEAVRGLAWNLVLPFGATQTELQLAMLTIALFFTRRSFVAKERSPSPCQHWDEIANELLEALRHNLEDAHPPKAKRALLLGGIAREGVEEEERIFSETARNRSDITSPETPEKSTSASRPSNKAALSPIPSTSMSWLEARKAGKRSPENNGSPLFETPHQNTEEVPNETHAEETDDDGSPEAVTALFRHFAQRLNTARRALEENDLKSAILEIDHLRERCESGIRSRWLPPSDSSDASAESNASSSSSSDRRTESFFIEDRSKAPSTTTCASPYGEGGAPTPAMPITAVML